MNEEADKGGIVKVKVDYIVACFLIFAFIPACSKCFSSADKQVVHEYNKEVGQ